MKILHSPEQLRKLCTIQTLSNDINKALIFTYVLKTYRKPVSSIITNLDKTVINLNSIIKEELDKYNDYIGKECLVPINKTWKVTGGYITEFEYVKGKIINNPRLEANELYASVEVVNNEGIRETIYSNLNDLKDI